LEPAISIKDLSYNYPDGKKALNSVNLSIFPGEKVAIVGPNGAGKSTLLLQLNGVYSGNGIISIAGLECTKSNLNKIRADVGVVFQDPDDQLFSITVFDDVAYGPRYQGFSRQVVQTRVNRALSAVQMGGFDKRNPYHLSGGEKKRIAIATVLSMEPKILVFDEPTTGLDPRARRELIELLHGLPQTMLLATHDLDLVQQLTPRMIIMNNGSIVADGQSKTLLTDEQLLFTNGLC
jgi:energy-coupling factor transporter ATP-binding protein EcfA2